MANFGDILDLPLADFREYFRTDNLLIDLKERINELELSVSEKKKYEKKYKEIQGLYNWLKGKAFERKVLNYFFRLLRNQESDLVQDLTFIELDFKLNYHLESGREIDIVIIAPEKVIVIECKDYEDIEKINKDLVDKFIQKIKEIKKRYNQKEIKPIFLSKNGLTSEVEDCLQAKGFKT